MRHVRRHLLLTLIASISLTAPLVRAEIIISEIMYNPAGPDRDATAAVPFNREWVELYNNGPAAINLAGFQLGGSTETSYSTPFPTGSWLQPQSALVVTGDSTTFDAMWGKGINRIQVGNFPDLVDPPTTTAPLVALRDGNRNFFDRVYYQSTTAGWPRVDNAQGQSIFARPVGLGGGTNNVGKNWSPSMWGAYGARFSSVGGENHASPGVVVPETQSSFAPSPEAAWSLVVLPDTQNYVKSTADRGIFTKQTQWIRDNRDRFHIQAVLHEGDIVNDFPSVAQWQNAKASMSVLNGQVPYIMVPGNHDYDNHNMAARITKLNEYFKPTDNPLNDPARGGILKGQMKSGELENAYYSFTAPDGRKMLVLALEWEPRPEVVAWANSVAARTEFADHTAVMLTHAYLFNNNLRYERAAGGTTGKSLWQDLVKRHDNFEMVFNGHFGGDGVGYLASTGDKGNTVHQMLLDTQHETNGGDGWLRVLEFLNAGKTVRVRTYSPHHDMYRDHPDFQFQFQISQLPPRLPGDYNFDGIVDGVDYIVWLDSVGKTVPKYNLADGNGNGIIDQADLEIWRSNLTRGIISDVITPIAIPEPSATVLMILAINSLAATRRPRS
jgi:hypothetical protein